MKKRRRKQKSVLEAAFEKAFRRKLEAAGFEYAEQVTLHGARFRYDVRLLKVDTGLRILVEIDGHGLGHSSVASLARDARKGNHAVFEGYRFFRLTTKHFKTKKGKRIPGPYALEWLEKVTAL